MADAAQDVSRLDSRTVIGWREYVALPDWSIGAIKAKADTGARTSAIDVANVIEINPQRVRFEIVIDRSRRDGRVQVEADVYRRTRIRSSLGDRHDRIIVQARLRLGPVEKVVQLGLVSRPAMLCRMLLGRAALEPHFLVDPGQIYLFGRRPRRTKVAGRKEEA